jgi:hypothetical protein
MQRGKHFDPFQEDKDRQAHERGRERKALVKFIDLGARPMMQGRRLKPKPITLPKVWKEH